MKLYTESQREKKMENRNRAPDVGGNAAAAIGIPEGEERDRKKLKTQWPLTC